MLKFCSHFLGMIILFTQFVSCGDLYSKKAEDKKTLGQFTTCSMELNIISKIMTQKIGSELNCLGSNLSLFIRLIKSRKPGYLDKEALNRYLTKDEETVDQSTLDIISAMFDLSSLIFGDQPGFIKATNVNKLTELLVEVNELVVDGNVYSFFSADEKISYDEHNRRKSIIFNSLVRVGKVISSALVNNSNEIDFVKTIEKFKNKENEKHLAYAKNLLFIKQAVIGGDRDRLNSKELKRSLKLLGDIGKIAYDFTNLPDTKTEENEVEEVVKILKEDSETISRNFLRTEENSDSVLITYNDMIRVLADYAPEFLKYTKYKKEFLLLKKVFLGNSNEYFTFKEIESLLNDVVILNLRKAFFNYRNFNLNEGILTQKKKLRYRLKNYVTLDREEGAFASDMNRIIKNYRFYHGSSFSPMLGFEYHRNPKGLLDIGLFEDITMRFFKAYGTKDDNALGGYILTLDQLKNLMGDFQGLIEGEELLLPNRSVSTAETIAVVTSLFHAQSNGDSRIEVPEFVEFITTMTTALSYSNRNIEFLKGRCDFDKKGRVSSKCFRENFLTFMDSDAGPGGERVDFYLPLLKKYLKRLGSERKIEEYLVATTRFSRACNRFNDGAEVPMKLGDFIVTWAGLLVIEQSMLKFDLDQSGVLEVDEVNRVYLIYEDAVRGLVPNSYLKNKKSVLFSLFKYLVKYKRGPRFEEVDGLTNLIRNIKQGGHLGLFHVRGQLPFSESFVDAKADRMTFASVLRVIAENAPSKKLNPYNCNFLR